MNRQTIILAILLGLALGAVIVLLDALPGSGPQIIVLHSDPAAYQISEIIEEARRITGEAAHDS
jgi:hypothetical protein